MADDTNSAAEAAETVDATVPDAAEPSQALAQRPSDWGGKIVLWLGIGSPLVALIAALGSAWGIWIFSKGFLGLAAAFAMALLAVLLGLVIGWRNRKKGVAAPKIRRWVGMGAGAIMAGWFVSLLMTAFSVPAIHDISTDLADPPQFQSLALRSDNWDAVPGADDSAMKGMTPQQRWEVIHREDYGDIRTVRINQPVVDVIAKAERLAKIRGWDVAVADPVQGRLEATATTRFFRFKDDVVLRVRPAENGAGSVVDMRSVSRVGQSDLGVNAKRVREFLADLSGTVSAG